MSVLLDRGMSMLLRAAPKAAGGKIMYSRGSDCIWLYAIWGRNEIGMDTGDGSVRVEHSDRDFIIDAGRLVLGGQLTTPQKGDRIKVGENDIFEVLPLDGVRCYRQSDPQGRMIRVYVKKVSDG
jgi:hypothetical protein